MIVDDRDSELSSFLQPQAERCAHHRRCTSHVVLHVFHFHRRLDRNPAAVKRHTFFQRTRLFSREGAFRFGLYSSTTIRPSRSAPWPTPKKSPIFSFASIRFCQNRAFQTVFVSQTLGFQQHNSPGVPKFGKVHWTNRDIR